MVVMPRKFSGLCDETISWPSASAFRRHLPIAFRPFSSYPNLGADSCRQRRIRSGLADITYVHLARAFVYLAVNSRGLLAQSRRRWALENTSDWPRLPLLRWIRPSKPESRQYEA